MQRFKYTKIIDDLSNDLDSLREQLASQQEVIIWYME